MVLNATFNNISVFIREPPPRGAVFNPVTQAEHEVAIEKPPKRQEPDGSQIANIKRQDADSKQVFKLYFSLFRPI
jgi:hypothetical protein